MFTTSSLTSERLTEKHGPTSGMARVSCVLVIAIFAFQFGAVFHYQSQTRGDRLHDFPTFYAAAKLALQHGDIYTAGATKDVRYVYPPLIAFAFTPLTLFSLRGAAHVFGFFNTLMAIGSLGLATKSIRSRLKIAGRSIFWPSMLLCSILSYPHIRNVLVMGETDILMLFLFTLAFYWIDAHPILSGSAIGFAFNIKYLSIVAVPYYLLRRRWTAAIATLVSSIFFALVPALLLGWQETVRDVRISMGGLLLWVGVTPERSHSIRVHDIADDLSVSLTSAVARVIGPHGFSNSAVMVLAGIIGVIVVLFVGWMYRREGFSLLRWPRTSDQSRYPFTNLIALEWPGLVAAAIIFSPDSNTRHMVMGVLVNVLAAVLVIGNSLRVSRNVIIGAVIMFVTYTMPFGRELPALHLIYYRYSLPCCGLLIGYALTLRTGLLTMKDRPPTVDSPAAVMGNLS